MAAGLNSANETANTANATASSANTAATNAGNKADAAQSTADAAKTAATNAQTLANTANTNATAAKDAIDKLEVGGRNLLVGTGTASGDVSASSKVIAVEQYDDLYSGLTGVQTNEAWSGRYFNLKAVAERGGFRAGDNLVISVYIKSDTEQQLTVSCHRTYGTGNINGSDKKYINTLITPQ